jgi:hypothetical protein
MMHILKDNLSLYLNKENLTLASGATPIRSAGRAPDELQLSTIMEEQKIDFIMGNTR